MVFILIPVIWVFSLLVSIPTLIEYSVNNITVIDGNKHNTQLSCGSQQKSWDFSLSNAIFVNIVSYFIPVIILFRNYIQVAIYVWKKGRKIRNKPGPTGHNLTSLLRFKSTIQLVKLLVAVAVIFAVSWLPFFIILLYAVRYFVHYKFYHHIQMILFSHLRFFCSLLCTHTRQTFRERERERDRQTDRQTEIDRQRQSEKKRDRERLSRKRDRILWVFFFVFFFWKRNQQRIIFKKRSGNQMGKKSQ